MRSDRVENIPIREEELINRSSEPFLRRMLSQRSGILVCSCPNELEGERILGILATHSMRLSLQHVFTPSRDMGIYDLDSTRRLSSDDANELTRNFLEKKPDYRFFEQRIDSGIFTEMVEAVMGQGLLSTGHIPADSSFLALDKILEMTTSRTMIASIVNGVFGINYVHVICPFCKVEIAPSQIDAESLITGELDGANLRRFAGKGCPECDNTGYHGCEVLCECLEMTPPIREAVLHGAGLTALKRLSKSAGTTTFLDTAWAFFRAGITTLDEVKRIAKATS